MTNAKYKIIQMGNQRSIVEIFEPNLPKILKIRNYFFKEQIQPKYKSIGKVMIINNNDLMTLDEMGFIL